MSAHPVEIVKLDDVIEHPNADRLEIAVVHGGWQTIVPKGAYAKGSLVVYIPIDSLLSEKLENMLFPPESKITLRGVSLGLGRSKFVVWCLRAWWWM